MKSFRSLTIQARLWTAFLGVLLGVGAVAGIAMDTIDAVKIRGDAYDRIYSANILLADVLPPPAYIVESYLVASQLTYTSDPAKVRELKSTLASLRDVYEERHRYWTENPVSSDFDGPLLEDSYDAATRFFDIVDTRLLPAVDRGDLAAARSIASTELASAYGDHRAAIDTVVDLATDYNAEAESDATSLLASRGRLLWAAIVVCIGASGAVVAFVVRSLSRRLRETSSVILEASRQLATINETIRVQADHTASRSAEAVSSGQEVSSGMQTLSYATDQLSISIAEISRSAAQVSGVADEAGCQSQLVIDEIERLAASSSEIGQVVEMINGIAEQTNLLALNATIEAARAGEVGRGFAVVANEVKELANKTSNATVTISGRIQSVQDETASAIEAIRAIAATIGEINDLQGSVASAVEEQAAMTSEISRSITDTSQGTEHMASTLTEMKDAVDTVAERIATTEETVDHLNQVAHELIELVGA